MANESPALARRVAGRRSNGNVEVALISITCARRALDRYSRTTDEPTHGTVEAADLLDAARDYLVMALVRDPL